MGSRFQFFTKPKGHNFETRLVIPVTKVENQIAKILKDSFPLFDFPLLPFALRHIPGSALMVGNQFVSLAPFFQPGYQMIPKEFKIEYSAYQNSDELPALAQELLAEAISALDSAYSPYSQFQVGAALRLSNGKTVRGSNQENAAYPSGLCAERTAIYFAGAEYPKETITGLLVVARKQGETQLVPACPCGGCRQAMLEYEERQNKAIPVFFKRAENEWVKLPSVASLLPFKFDSASL